MAQISDMRNNNRVDLGDAIPISTPFVLQVEPANFCNLKCGFCPVIEYDKQKSIKKEAMTFKTFTYSP